MKKLKPYLVGIWYSLPVQLLLLHFKRYQVLLVFWYVLFATVNGSFLHRFGAHILYLYPEYLGEINAASLALVGAAVAVFFMSWNITTFILHAKHIRFLATTTQPFLKYCINNSIIPVVFLIFYLVKATGYVLSHELLKVSDILGLSIGFMAGFALAVALGFTYFFGADRTIYRLMAPGLKEELIRYKNTYAQPNGKREKGVVRVDWYLSATARLRRPRNVHHYTQDFIDRLFKQHHLAAVISVMIAFGSLILVGFGLENRYLQLPAAASITVFFAILIAVAGAFSYFLQSWAMLSLLIVFFGLNILYKQKILDPRNKAFGLYYASDSLPNYNKASLLELANPADISADSLRYIGYLNQWKARQPSDTPVMIIASFSGGGSRSATFSTYVLQHLDSLTNDRLMPATFMFFGASGGMVGASWYRELYWRKLHSDTIHPGAKIYADAISRDLLNPIFTSFVVRDLLAPTQHYHYQGGRYVKDRGYAFEDKLNQNTFGWLDKTFEQYRQAEDSGLVPRLLMNAVITRDGRKLLMGTSPVRFLMRPIPDSNTDTRADPDAVDFMSYFKNQRPGRLRMLSALRMNATFPYILPNVWLPTQPVIDVMDAGFRDNTGLESSLRFLYYFRHWLKDNCSRILLVQVRDKQQGGWESPVESNSIFDLVTKPALLSQNNLFRFQEYAQMRELEWFGTFYGNDFSRVVVEYEPTNKDAAASMSFHLTQKEKQDLKGSLKNVANSAAFNRVERLFKQETVKEPEFVYPLGYE